MRTGFLGSPKAVLFSLLFAAGLSLLLTTCKKGDSRSAGLADQPEKNFEFIVFRTNKDTAAAIQRYYQMHAVQGTSNVRPLDEGCSGDAFTNVFGVVRTGSCSGGYSYSLKIDDMEYLTGEEPTDPIIVINGASFAPTFTYNSGPAWHYTLTVPYSEIGYSNSSYCSTSSIPLEYDACGGMEINTETYIMDVSEACGQNGSNTTSTANSYTYPPFGTGGTGGVTLSPLISLCNECTVQFPDNYTYQYKLTGSSTWTGLTLSFPTYINYFLSLPAGTYDLQGFDNCNGDGTEEAPVNQTGPVEPMPGSGTFTVP
jgi:hypothetical protein